MADKEALRALQNRLAQRLQEARSTVRGQAWLAVECGGRGFLFPLQEAGEISSMAPISGISHAQPWFLGVANLRGQLHGVVDLAGFLGLAAVADGRDQAMLVGFNTSFDVNAACSGFVYGLVTAHGLIAMGARKVLLIGTDSLSRITDWEDRNPAVLFGDGSGAVVLEAVEGPGQLLAWDLDADGSLGRLLYAEVGGFGHLLLFGFDYIDDAAAWKHSMELMAHEVLPRVAHLTGD